MRQAVRDALYDFNVQYEAAIPYFYQDVRGLVSIGVGILADPIVLALTLPLLRSDGTPATQIEIAAEWERIKVLGLGDAYDNPPNPAAKYGHLYAKPHTTLHLDDAGLRSTLDEKAAIFDRQLGKRFPGWESWPADAQLAIMSLTWACGSSFRFPRLDAALRQLDFATAADEVKMDDSRNPGVRPRNAANRMLLLNAARVQQMAELHSMSLDPDTLYWPRDLSSE